MTQEMLAEIIRELTNNDKNVMIPSEPVLIWAKELKLKECRWQLSTA